ncbi:MAG: ATP-binding cassette domain-containing protein [Gammaproteobacteria bacterium]|nr:ATP-binding cassette domain-containing protein [Gammaproteobacteria bacterium]MYK47644.1 ATP-binding cassette domain-containing protein [Gammaproteobacteria bacterium]
MGNIVSRDTHRAAFPLAGDSSAWRVDSGAVDVFFVHVNDGIVNAPYKHVLRAAEGQVIFGIDPLDLGDDGQLELWAKGLPGFSLHATTVGELIDRDDAVAAQVDQWITSFTDSVARDIMPVPRADAFVSLGHVPDLQAVKVVSARGGVVWLSGLRAASYLGLVDATDHDADWLPLTLQSWVTVSGSQDTVVAASSAQLHESGTLEEALGKFHRRLLDAERVNRLLEVVDEANLQMDRSTRRREDEEQARDELKRLFEQTDSDAAIPALHEALNAVGAYEGFEFQFPDPDPDASHGDPVVEIAFSSRVRARAVRLDSVTRWWFGDNSALLGFHSESGSPIALLPGRFGRYRLRDPATRKTTTVTRAVAGKLHKYAWMFIRPLPERPVKARDALKLFANKTGSDSIRYAVSGLIAGLISFAPAAMVAVIVDWLIPARSDGFLYLAMATLVLLAVAGCLVQLRQGTTLVHVEGRGAARLTAAIWDRLLRLKRDDVRGFKTGEISQRAFVVQALRENTSGIVSGTLSSILFLLPILGLLFLYDATLATTSLALGVLGLIVVASFGFRQVTWQRRYHDAQQTLAGDMFQFVNGIEKLRATGAESSVFAFWVRGYLDKKQAEIKVERLNALATAVTGSLPMFAAACLFAVVLMRPDGPIELGAFLAVFAASMTFFSAITRMGGSVGALASLFPAYQQLKPLFDPSLEARTSASVAPIRRIQGEVRLDHVTFSYEEAGPQVLRDVSLHVRPGEFVAIVGESGSGKSSLLRLILGLERPSTGAVYFDERNLRYLDDLALRRQIGVVMQNGSLQPGTILQNIVGINSEATLEDAWSAARKASLADDIRAMEMGMHTPVGEHSGLFSGGQVQRILIAAALVRDPSIILLDEATNWLDNKSQAEVMRSIGEIAATRIVVAHRLSTIKNADRIYVLSHGRVVQSGTFTELAAAPGTFQTLIARQVT